jgi:hypothetical protein
MSFVIAVLLSCLATSGFAFTAWRGRHEWQSVAGGATTNRTTQAEISVSLRPEEIARHHGMAAEMPRAGPSNLIVPSANSRATSEKVGRRNRANFAKQRQCEQAQTASVAQRSQHTAIPSIPAPLNRSVGARRARGDYTSSQLPAWGRSANPGVIEWRVQ